MYAVNAANCIEELANTRCKVDILPSVYLGLPLGAKNNYMEVRLGVIDNREKKLAP